MNKVTLDEAIRLFLLAGRAEATNRVYKRVLGRLTAALGTQQPVNGVKLGDLLDFVEAMRSGGKLKDSSIHLYVNSARAFFNWCADTGLIDESPARRLHFKAKPAESIRSRAIPPDDLEMLIQHARRTSPRSYALLLMLADAGCRIGGLASLTLPNLNLDERSARLFEKGSKWLSVYYSAETAGALRAYLATRPQLGDEHVFIGERGYAMTARAMSELVRGLSEKLCSRAYGPHSIRHGVGMGLAADGVSLTAISAKLGHAGTGITARYYLRPDNDYVRQVSDEHPLAALRHRHAPPGGDNSYQTPPADSEQHAPRIVKFPKVKHA